MIPDPVGWFAMGATFGLVLCGWPWHPRFSRYKPRRMGPPRGSYGLPPDHDWRRISGLGEPSPPQGDWMDEAFPLPPPDVMDAINRQLDRDIAAEVARWGADQELEACCESLGRLVRGDRMAEYLRATRRKPPSLKQQALEALKHAPGPDHPSHITLLTADEHALIRSALEALPDG